MKSKCIIVSAIAIATFSLSSCATHVGIYEGPYHEQHHHHHHHIPPGQIKKMTGEQSAKHHAPGHHKHHKY